MPEWGIRGLIGLLIPIVGVGTAFFHFVEGWSWIDAYFFSVVTLSTVGYGALVPATALGKIGTTVYIFLGLGVFAAVIQQFGFSRIKRRALRAEMRIQREQVRTKVQEHVDQSVHDN